MRFRTKIKNVNTFTKIAASLNLLGKVAWIKLDDDTIRFTVIPEQGTQVFAVLAVEVLFEDDYLIQSAIAHNVINLEVPLAPLHRALKSAQNALSAQIRLTKKENIPYLVLTIVTQTPLTSSGRQGGNLNVHNPSTASRPPHGFGSSTDLLNDDFDFGNSLPRETTITQEIIVRVLPAQSVEGIHEPLCPDPEVHIQLPPLQQLKSISERFTKLALDSNKKAAANIGLQSMILGPRLEFGANMHGELRLGIKTDQLRIESKWTGLTNPELDVNGIEGGAEGVKQHPSERMKGLYGEESWATVRVEARDWGRVLGVGRLGGRVIACFCHESALILYVYLSNEEGGDESVLTYYIKSYSE